MRYIVGVDGSAPSESAVSWAVSRARRDRAPLVVVHVVDAEAGRMGPDFRAEATELGRRLLERTQARLRTEEPTLELSSELLEGSTPWELTRFTRAGDVLVVGTHKTGFSSGRVLGSRSVQIAAACRCTVAVIPATDVRFRRGVVAGIDREETARHIVDVAAHEATVCGDQLTLVHAGLSGAVADDAPLQVALACARTAYPELVVQARRSNRAPSAALLDAARSQALLVIGPGSTGIERSPIGSVLHEILLNANTPVLVAGLPPR
ncbi:MAG: universal stress protein [Pseudolysinimonas sp.]|uniref:universal stress protein n=1 Tax=Pseudolysinimonas sp. TaxID=2680009 RepID=UPI003C744711